MNLTERYLSLLKSSLLNELYIENEARIVYLVRCAMGGIAPDLNVVRDAQFRLRETLSQLQETRNEGRISFMWQVPQRNGGSVTMNLRNFTEVYHTMIGKARLNNVHELLDRVMRDGIPGDVIETGVWRGGATIFMRGYLAAHSILDRKVWVADSFEGLPVPTAPQDAGYDFSAGEFPGLSISVEEVQALFSRYALLDDRVAFLKGWFKDTLPTAPIQRLSLMRLDGDLYESTMDALNALWSKLSRGGFVIVDDYNDFEPCRRACIEFRERHGITSPIHRIDWTGVWWRKE